MKTAVEWLLEELTIASFDQQQIAINKAKEMEKELMQKYATFCIECDRREMPLLLFEDWCKNY